jgi:hypothetical protein
MIRKLYFPSVLLIISFIFLNACKKEKISPTQAELTANELRSVIEKNAIRRVYPVRIDQPIPTPFSEGSGMQWSFSNGFFYVNYSSFYDAYNLTYLVRYGISNVPLSNGSSDRALLLYMEQ